MHGLLYRNFNCLRFKFLNLISGVTMITLFPPMRIGTVMRIGTAAAASPTTTAGADVLHG